MRSTWSGAISFGMVVIPIKAYTSTDEKSVKFNQLHRECGGRIKSPKTCPTCAIDLDADAIVRGYEVSKGSYVQMEDADFDGVPTPTTKVINIERFIPSSDEQDVLHRPGRSGSQVPRSPRPIAWRWRSGRTAARSDS